MDFGPNFEEVQSGDIRAEIEEPKGTVEEMLELVPSQTEASLFENESAWVQALV